MIPLLPQMIPFCESGKKMSRTTLLQGKGLTHSQCWAGAAGIIDPQIMQTKKRRRTFITLDLKDITAKLRITGNINK
jgi:hypothetical protein